MTTIAKKIHEELKKSQNILIVSHKNPDGDTLSSACALMQYLRNLGKNHVAFCATPVAKNLAFLPHIEYFTRDPLIFKNNFFDIIVVVDSGDLVYAGIDEYIKNLEYNPIIVNIDHHPTNNHYGHRNLVMPEAASTTEILYNFFRINNIKLDKHIATCLLTGIITDTGHFSNPATSSSALKIASRLLTAGANLQLIQGWTLKNKPLKALRLWGRILSRLHKNEEYDIATAIITAEDLKEFKLDDEEIEGVANFLNNLAGAKIVMLLKDKGNGMVKASLRTSEEEIDVSKIAQLFGGGGHAKAAGFSVEGKLLETTAGWKIV